MKYEASSKCFVDVVTRLVLYVYVYCVLICA